MGNAILLFREDLRLADHAALSAAVADGHVLTCAFIHDPDAPHAAGGARRWWLHHSLEALQRALEARGGQLVLRLGPMQPELERLIADTGATDVYWSRRYAPGHVAQDKDIKAALEAKGIRVHSHPGRYLFEPWDIRSQSGTPFRVFTPFWRTCRRQIAEYGCGMAQHARERISFGPQQPSPQPDDLKLLPHSPNWATRFPPQWQPGELGAQRRLEIFLSKGIDGYASGRDRPADAHVSRLSPHLQMGEITPRLIVAATQRALDLGQVKDADAEKFLAELGWREFSAHLLFHNPDIEHQEFQPKFRGFPWRRDAGKLAAWQRGETGYPIVDAGMRELWATGYMHNRVRMVAASFLVKHLRIDWRAGRDWFWDTLVDADQASNTASWQWVSGCGADAAPYFRVFNPITQARKFDPSGSYIRTWLPEIARLPDKYLAAPWEAPAEVLTAAGVTLGQCYPHPIVDHKTARAKALSAFENLSPTVRKS